MLLLLFIYSMAEQGIKYKFGDSDLDLANYIHNLETNVSPYLENKARKAGWNEGQQQEFRNAYTRYIGVLKDQLAGKHTRLSTNALGVISDTNGELNDTDQDDFWYNKEGEQISGEDYGKLKDRKKKKYNDFKSSREVASYMQLIGRSIQQKMDKPAPKLKYDQSKHGFKAWWGTVKNLNGGNDLTPYLNLDPVGSDGKRSRNNRAKKASPWVTEYANWLKGLNLDYSDSPVNGDERQTRLAALASSWGNGWTDDEDFPAAASAGIDDDWLQGYFTDKENPLKSQAQIDADAEKAKAEAESAEAKAKSEADEQARRAWIDKHYANYNTSRGTNQYYDGSVYGDNYGYLTGLPATYASDDEFMASFKEGTPEYNKYIDPNATGFNKLRGTQYLMDWLANPFTSESRRALWLLNSLGKLHALDDGSYYIPQADDEQKARALVYNPQRGTLRYTFIGNIPLVWNRMKDQYKASQNPNHLYETYGEGGNLPKLQLGGYFDVDQILEDRMRESYEKKGAEKGRTAEQQQAANRIIGSHPGNGEKNGTSTNNTWESDDYARATAAVGDIISGVSAFVPGYGTAVSAVSGLTSTALNAYADIMDDSVSFGDVLKNAAINLGFDAAGLIPVGGNATSTFGKIARNSGKIISRAAMALGTMGAFNNRDAIMKSFGKFSKDPTHMDVEDWQNIAQGLCVAFGITGAVGRKLTQKVEGYNSEKGLPYDRKGVATPDQNSVAVEMVNKNTGQKEMRVFTGDDAVKIREAQTSGDNNALRAATVEKFAELKDMDIATGMSTARVRGFHDDQGWHLNPLAKQEGTPRIYNIATGTDGRTFIQRGKWTGDIVTTDSRVKNAGKTNEQVAQEKFNAENDAIRANSREVQAAISNDERMAHLVEQAPDKIRTLEADLQTKQDALNQFNTANSSVRASSTVQADIDRINTAQSSYSSRLSKYQKRASIADEVDTSGTVTRKGKASLAYDRWEGERRKLNGDINTKNTELALASDADKPRVQAELDALIKQREKAIKMRDLAKNARDKAKTMADADKQWLDANDKALLNDDAATGRVGLNTELTNSQSVETQRRNLESPIEKMKARIESWKQYTGNDLRSPASIKLEAKKTADGKYEFTLPGHSDPVVRTWDQIRQAYGLKYRRGGSIQMFQTGTNKGGINNTVVNGAPLNWYNDMFLYQGTNGSPMHNYIWSIQSDQDIENFNNLQKSWRANLNETKYDPSNPSKAMGGGQGHASARVYSRQGLWHKTGNNEQIGALQTSGRATPHSGGRDTKASNYQDGWFGEQEYLRHAGSLESWEDKDALAKFQKQLLDERGLEYYLDPESNMYLLRRKPDLNPQKGAEVVQTGVEQPVSPVVETSPVTPKVEENPVETPVTPQPPAVTPADTNPIISTQQNTETPKPSKSFNWPSFELSPETKAQLMFTIPRNMIANNYNDMITDLAKQNARDLFLENPIEHQRPIFSDIREEIKGQQQYADLMNRAERPLTSDASLQTAMMLDSAVQGQKFIGEGLAASDKMLRTTSELAEQDRRAGKEDRHKKAEANRETQVEAKQKIRELEQMRLSKKYTNDDTIRQQMEFDYKRGLAETKARTEAYTKSDIHNAVMYDLKAYAPDVTPEELAAWNKHISGISYTDLSEAEQKLYLKAAQKASQAEQDQLRSYYGIGPSKWSNVRTVSQGNPAPSADSFEDDVDAYLAELGVTTVVPEHKSGGSVGEKIEVQKLRNKSKDHDRFHKNVQKNIDRNEKSLDRCSKYSRKRRT